MDEVVLDIVPETVGDEGQVMPMMVTQDIRVAVLKTETEVEVVHIRILNIMPAPHFRGLTDIIVLYLVAILPEVEVVHEIIIPVLELEVAVVEEQVETLEAIEPLLQLLVFEVVAEEVGGIALAVVLLNLTEEMVVVVLF